MAYRDELPACGWCKQPIEKNAKAFGSGHLHEGCDKDVTQLYTTRVQHTFKYGRCPHCGGLRNRLLSGLAQAASWASALAVAGFLIFYFGTCALSCGERRYCSVTEDTSKEAEARGGKFLLSAARRGSGGLDERIGHFPTVAEALKAAEALKCPVK